MAKKETRRVVQTPGGGAKVEVRKPDGTKRTVTLRRGK